MRFEGLAALRFGLGGRFLIEADLAAGGEEEVVDATGRHRADNGVGDVAGGRFGPLAG